MQINGYEINLSGEELEEIVPVNDFLYIDLPEDTISTESYYTDVIVPVTLKKEAPAQ